MQPLRSMLVVHRIRPVFSRSVKLLCASLAAFLIVGVAIPAYAGCSDSDHASTRRDLSASDSQVLQLTMRIEYVAGGFSIRYTPMPTPCDGMHCNNQNRMQPMPRIALDRGSNVVYANIAHHEATADCDRDDQSFGIAILGAKQSGFPARIKHPPRKV